MRNISQRFTLYLAGPFEEATVEASGAHISYERTFAMRPKVVCAWCSDVIRRGRGPVSHGICKSCLAVVLQAAESHVTSHVSREAV